MATGHLTSAVDTRAAGEGVKNATRPGLFVKGRAGLTMRPAKPTRPNTTGTEQARGKLTSTEDERALREPESLMPGVYAPGHNMRTMGTFLDPDKAIKDALEAGLPSAVRARRRVGNRLYEDDPSIVASPEEKTEMTLGAGVIADANSTHDAPVAETEGDDEDEDEEDDETGADQGDGGADPGQNPTGTADDSQTGTTEATPNAGGPSEADLAAAQVALDEAKANEQHEGTTQADGSTTTEGSTQPPVGEPQGTPGTFHKPGEQS